MNDNVKPRGKGRRQLTMIILLFSIPPLIAYMVWKNLDSFSSGATNNNGTLVHPARPLDFMSLQDDQNQPLDAKATRGHWTFVVFGNNGCDEACKQQLYIGRQTRISINKDMTRVRRLLILTESPDSNLSAFLAEQHRDLVVSVTSASSASLISNFSGDDFGSTGKQYFLVDPIGNLMMFYSLEINPHAVLKDLQKLLKVSQIG